MLAVAIHGPLLAFDVYDVNPRGGWLHQGPGGTLVLLVSLTLLVLVVLLTYMTDWLDLFNSPAGRESFKPESADVADVLQWLELQRAGGE